MSKSQTVDLGLSNHSRHNHPWDFPNCPNCDRHIYVDRSNHAADFVCHKCSEMFDQPSYHDLREELRQ